MFKFRFMLFMLNWRSMWIVWANWESKRQIQVSLTTWNLLLVIIQPGQLVSTSGINWQQTETAICHSWRPRRQPNCHTLWRPVICCCRTQSLESSSSGYTCDRHCQCL